MVAVMISALVLNWYRPVTQIEAEQIAEQRFRKIPGASQRVGRYTVHAWSVGTKHEGDAWCVDFKDSGDGTLLVQMFVTSTGKTRAIGIVPGKFN
jgi:hypothetical protein